MNLTEPGVYVKAYTNYYTCIKFESSTIKNGIRKAKKVQITRSLWAYLMSTVNYVISSTPSP